MIKFKSPIDFENIRKVGFYNTLRSGTGYLDYVISVTDFGYLVQVQDITEHRKAEKSLKKDHDTLELKIQERTAELEQAYSALKASEEKFRELFNKQVK